MKKTRTCLLTIALALGGAILLNQTQSRAEPKPATKPAPATSVAVCDVVDVFAHSLRAQEANKEFDKRARALADENKTRKEAIQKLISELEAYRSGQPQYEKIYANIRTLELERKVWTASEKDKIDRDEYLLAREIYDRIFKAVAVAAKERGIDTVLFQRQGSLKGEKFADLLKAVREMNVLYHSDAVDLTAEVITRVNDNHRLRK